ncbi:MAG: NUDIX hydrolase [Caldilineaceae bacterium]
MAILQDEQLLLVRQTYRGETLWTFPGGGRLEGETPASAAVREVKEETNLEGASFGCFILGHAPVDREPIIAITAKFWREIATRDRP